IYSSTADYIDRGLREAEREHAELVMLKINTPGGLLKPTRRIVGEIMSSKIPVVSYVTPPGAHAGSAGSFIALSSDVVAMAPGTNIGAAHPVSMGKSLDSVLSSKITNDAVDFIRSIAEKRNRNPELLKEMVVDSRSFSARQALDNAIVDLIAPDLTTLLHQLDQWKIEGSSGGERRLNTKDAIVKTLDMGLKVEFLNTLNNPDVMFVLLLIGILGILFEVFNPGGLVPGILGILCLILAAYGMT